MSDPNPTAADEWTQWDTHPSPPAYWPGLGDEHRRGFEIDRRGVKVVAGGLLKLATATTRYDAYPRDYGLNDDHWALPREIGRLLVKAENVFASYWRDLHCETGMAGLLIERASQRYDLADQPLLGDIPMAELDRRVIGLLSGDLPSSLLGELSEFYPNGSESLELPGAIDYGVGNMTAEKAKQDLIPYPVFGTSGLMSFGPAGDALAELSYALVGRAQDLRDAPWIGDAADRAQNALRQIHGNATALAAVAARLDTAATRFKEVAEWCRDNFERAVDPDRSGWDEFWDLGGTPDSRTRSFLAAPNSAFNDIYDNMPKLLTQDLPGLLVTDQKLTDLRESLQRVRTRPKTSEFLKENDAAFMVSRGRTLEGYEEAEKAFG
ncbi:hypothetical protein Misp01_63410 [Microtetraspora sp. NBRC 13810]|uniref:hypothetical protein n=1 Tax=Microtetraspora sp. NBRC 13810 TaxID=3030990 RepID=UPI0024A2F04D|nr:hypothetical protein [Microtetraspora sp. NBRC 13810]GLW11213.1 hypothetical protein Misp01_63410 [Microtetraspora sp. NBRC 13810]